MAGLVLSLLGPFQAACDGRPPGTGPQHLHFATDAARALLAYLAADRMAAVSYAPHRREMLAGLLWPEEPDRQAMQNLRQTLHYLRQGLGDTEADPPFLLVSQQSIQLNPASAC